MTKRLFYVKITLSLRKTCVLSTCKRMISKKIREVKEFCKVLQIMKKNKCKEQCRPRSKQGGTIFNYKRLLRGKESETRKTLKAQITRSK